jgi:hypothetical protein
MALITYHGVQNLALYAGGGSWNLLYVESTSDGTTTDVYGGSKNSQISYTVDEFVVSGGAGVTLDGIHGPLNLHGQTSTLCPLIMNDATTFGVQTYTLTAGAVNRTGIAPITFDGMIYGELYTSEFVRAVVNVQGTAPNVTTYVIAGAGDPVNVGTSIPGQGGNLANIQGTLVIDSGYAGQIPNVVIDDSGDTSAHPQVALSPASPYYQLSGLTSVPILFGLDPATPVSILGGSGAGTLTATFPGDLAANWTFSGFANLSFNV